MIKLLSIEVATDSALQLSFSDGSSGRWSAMDVIAYDTILTAPLVNPAYFARAFIDAGALVWPNGLEFSATSLHRNLGDADMLTRSVE